MTPSYTPRPPHQHVNQPTYDTATNFTPIVIVSLAASGGKPVHWCSRPIQNTRKIYKTRTEIADQGSQWAAEISDDDDADYNAGGIAKVLGLVT
mmetsp:Transcript_19270/g.40341  ORF Transcript_19270/g.40341 Transcript_19270/m.40341 type:complete len:94 (-) Transcript_19270:1354-1635(-)